MSDLDAEVLIVGGGPCGLVLANELGRRGVRTLLLSEREGTSPHPQANATQARTMEHYRRLGFADRIRAAGLPTDYGPDIAYFVRYSTFELARLQQPSSGAAGRVIRGLSGSWSAAELPHRCSQMYIEGILREEAESLASVDVRFGVRVTSFVDHGDHVEVEGLCDGVGVRHTAQYLAGTDGPRSVVRAGLGVSYEGHRETRRPFFARTMYSVYFRSGDFYDAVPHAKAWQYWCVNPERRGVMLALDGRETFVFQAQLLEGESPDDIDDIAAAELVCQGVGRDIDVEVIASWPWTAGLTLVAERYQDGRVFLAGDATHLYTPTGGLGYNTSVEDAVNLGWKLAAVVNGWADSRLLRTYEGERRPIARRNGAFSRMFADSLGGFTVPAEIEADDAAGAAIRAAVSTHLDGHVRAEFNIPGVTFGSRYDGSPLIVSDGAEPLGDQVTTYDPTASPGGRAPHAWLADGRSLYDVLGFDFTLLKLAGTATASELLAEADARGLPLAFVEISDPTLRELYEADLALIRPDQVVAWRGDHLPSDAAALLDRVTGKTADSLDRASHDDEVTRTVLTDV